MKKLCILILVLLVIPLVSASIQVTNEPTSNVVIPEINRSATFRFHIKNLGEDDIFEIYSLVGASLQPKGSFSITTGDTKNFDVNAWPSEKVMETPGTFSFEYKILGEKMGLYKGVLSIRIVNLRNALDINAYNIDLESDTATIYVKNRFDFDFREVTADFKSDFFDFSETFALEPLESKEFTVALDNAKVNNLTAGQYTITTNLEADGGEDTTQNAFSFTEKAETSTRESRKGIIVYKTIVEKINEGNLPVVVQVKLRKNIISRLFTTMNVEPLTSDRKGLFVEYVFQKEIVPGETYSVQVTTNWLYPLIILAFLIALIYLFKKYNSTFVVLKKRLTYVKTKRGEFALKITIIAKAKDYVESISIIDKIPAMLKVHNRFGNTEPDKIDSKNRRLEWNIDSLQSGEERIFSYIVYSKIAPVGKFELPTATAVYEKDGKMHEAESNKVFFLTEA